LTYPTPRYNLSMPLNFEEVHQLALELPYDDREKLSEELWWSLHPPADDLPQEEIDVAWGAEIARRIEEIDSGAVKLIPGRQVLAQMRRRRARLMRARPGK
jgi:putative addiction module component (TIGR02574 family)